MDKRELVSELHSAADRLKEKGELILADSAAILAHELVAVDL